MVMIILYSVQIVRVLEGRCVLPSLLSCQVLTMWCARVAVLLLLLLLVVRGSAASGCSGGGSAAVSAGGGGGG